jgi:ATP-binding cassette, subfamily B, bacterial
MVGVAHTGTPSAAQAGSGMREGRERRVSNRPGGMMAQVETVAKAAPRGTAGLAPLARLIPYVARYKPMVAAALAALALAAATTLVLPLAVRRMIDSGFGAADSSFVNSYFAVLVGVALLLATFSALRYYFVIKLGERVVSDVRRDVFGHVAHLSPGFFDTAQSGEIVSRLSADATLLKSAVGATMSLALRNTITGLGAVAAMMATSPKLGIIALSAIPLVALPLIFFGRDVRRRSRIAQDKLAEATAYATEQIGAVRTLQAFTNEGLVTGRYTDAVDEAFAAAQQSTRARALLTFFAISTVFSAVVGVLWVGSRDVLAGTMSGGTLSQFLLYAVIAAGAVGALAEVWSELNQAAGATERLVELLETPPAIEAPRNPVMMPEPPRGTVELKDIAFSYPARPDRVVLNGFNLAIKAGERVAIVGPSGSGKSTLFALMMRFYDPASGAVLIDGVDARTADPSSLRRRIALVSQDVTVFSTSVADNIAFGRPGAAMAEIAAAADAANATGFITALPEGFDTKLGERGVTLSGGQRQRIAIARAVLRDAPILLLDEATSALDAESESAVQHALDTLSRGRTTLIIAHRLATVLQADRIVVMDKGRIVEQGTHQSLVKKRGVYARLAKLQFENGAHALAAAG